MINNCNYYYKVVPFVLKNADATCQILVDMVFTNQIIMNLEVQINDMVVNAPNNHFKDLEDIMRYVTNTTCA